MGPLIQGSRARHCCHCVYSLLVSFVVLTYPLMTGVVPRITSGALSSTGGVMPSAGGVSRALVADATRPSRLQIGGAVEQADMAVVTAHQHTSLSAGGVSWLEDSTDILPSNLSIPRLIHQTWETEQIPAQLAEWVSSWPQLHQDWEHWFWTESASRLMIRRNFSRVLADTYVDYPYAINRADARRYFMLYTYGGVYADLDVQSLRSLEPLVSRYPCILAQEPREHQALLYANKYEEYVMPALMACRPHHPFFRLVLQSLPEAAPLATSLPWNDNVFYSTGPMFLTEVLQKYRRKPRPQNDQVYLAPPHWFMPTYDALNEPGFRAQCANDSVLTGQQLTVCQELRERGFKSGDLTSSLTLHHWVHSWGPGFVPKGYTSVKNVVPSIKIVGIH